jgi:predicted Zn-dependent protease
MKMLRHTVPTDPAKSANAYFTRYQNLVVYAFLAGLILFCTVMIQPVVSQSTESKNPIVLSPAQPHPLPAQLAQWSEVKNDQGDYFDQIKSLRSGFLIWSQFPVQVYIAPLPSDTLLKSEAWQQAITQAVAVWQPYLPLQFTTIAEQANIRISATPPKIRSGGRIRSAETRFELYVSDQQTLAHRMEINIRPNQTPQYISAAVRHELGHALGIWGHSQQVTDIMYFSQVRTPPTISARDVNTLKRIYQQPTQLGWPVK